MLGSGIELEAEYIILHRISNINIAVKPMASSFAPKLSLTAEGLLMEHSAHFERLSQNYQIEYECIMISLSIPKPCGQHDNILHSSCFINMVAPY